MNDIEIRPAQIEDAPIISLLGRVTFGETFGHLFHDPQDLLDYYEATFSVEKIKRSIQSPNSRFWISYVSQLPVGFAKLKLNSPSEFLDTASVCQLQKIYVLKDFLSKRVGRELQNTLLVKAKELEFDTIWLSVLRENQRAIKFYTKNGFTAFGNHEFSIGKESFQFIDMSKPLITTK